MSEKYRVTGRTAVNGVEPGEVFEAELDPDQEQRLLDRGAVEKVRADAKVDADVPAEHR